MKKAFLILICLLAPALGHGAPRYILQGDNMNPSDVAAMNLNFDGIQKELLNTVHQASTETVTGVKRWKNNLSPWTGSTYNLGASGTNWAQLFVDTITASSITVTSIDSSNLYNSVANNLSVTRLGVSSVSITCDKLGVENFVLNSINLSPSTTTSGANGLDTGSWAVSTWASVWVIYNPNSSASAGLYSTNMTAPTLPSGYTKKRRVGFVYKNSSGNLDDFNITNDWLSWYKDVDAERSMSGTPAAGAWTDQTLASTTSPPIATRVQIAGRFTAAAAGAAAFRVRPKGAAWTANTSTDFVVTNGGSQFASGQTLILQNSSRQIQYDADNAGTIALTVLGFQIPPY